MTVSDATLGLADADWPGAGQLILGVAVLAVALALGAVVFRGVTWLFFGDWFRTVGTATVLAVLLLTGAVSAEGAVSWVQQRVSEIA